MKNNTKKSKIYVNQNINIIKIIIFINEAKIVARIFACLEIIKWEMSCQDKIKLWIIEKYKKI